MWAGLAIGLLLLLLSPKLLRYWARYRTRENLLQADIYAAVYSEAAAEAVPPNLRDALAAASADLILLGFEFVGFVTSQERGYPAARTLSVLRHRAERTFATVAFAIVERRGVAVEFETLFADEWWLRTVNRRAHFILAPHDTGRVDDPYVATLAEQWQSHREAAASEMSRERRDVDLHGYIRHKGAAQADEAASAVRYGFARRLETGEGFRITSLGAQVVLRRQADASRRVADALPMRGVLAMRCPPEDLEVKYSNILHAQNRPSRRPWAFLLSVLAFAVAALPFPNWSWFLWLIPFLLLHELGHWSTMRLFGHHDARIRFIPFLGAATLSTMQFRKLSHEVIVLLAGPVPGILLGLGLFQLADLAHRPYLIWTAITLIAVNGVNLLPVHPLDGGRILHALVTAGRPNLDIALKAAAGVSFVVGAIAMRDPTMALLALGALLIIPPGLRVARMEARIRRKPGFAPSLSAPERRQFIFEALPDPPRGESNGWVQLVQRVEVPLSHGRPRFRRVMPWAGVYAICLGGLVAWTVNILGAVTRGGSRCPPRSRATALACNAPVEASDIDWSRPDADSIKSNPFVLSSRSDLPLAAFVWCTGATPGTAYVAQQMAEIRSAKELCPALPWELLPPETKVQRENARWTLNAISPARYALQDRDGFAYVDTFAKRAQLSSQYDPETVRLFTASLGTEIGSESRRLLAERVGKSPTDSCSRLRILSVTREGLGNDDNDDVEGAADAGASIIPVNTRVQSTRLSVGFATPGDVVPLRRYLCEAGCQVEALPYGSMDPRLHICF